MRWGGRELEVDVISFSVAMSACEKGTIWRCAVGLLNRMRGRKLNLDVIRSSAALSACEQGMVWKGALGLLDEMRGCFTR